MSKISFDELLVTDRLGGAPVGYEKVAQNVESPDEGQLEQDFARLAYVFLQDRAAGLLKYMLGFEVVNREEDGSKAVGIFGFKIGNDYYYVPAFFLNNQIKGMDMLYNKRTNMFVPLTEQWINFIANRQTIELGGSTNVDDVQRHFEAPNFYFLAEPPIGAIKASSATDSVHDAFDTWNKMQEWTSAMLEKDAEFQKAVAGAIATLSGQELPFEKTSENSPLLRYLEQHGGPRAVSTLLGAMKNAEFANAALTFYPDVASLVVTEFSEALAPKQASSLTVISANDSPSGDDKTRARLVRDGFAIQDKRKDGEKSEVYRTDYINRFSNPSQSGTYDVLLKGGRTVRAWVLMPSGTSKNIYVSVIDQDKHMMRRAEQSAVYVRDNEADEAVKDKTDAGPDIYGKAKDIGSMEIGKQYILVDKAGNASIPFEVRSIVAENGERIRVRVNFQGSYDITRRPTYGHDFENLHHGRNDCHSNLLTECQHLDYIEFADHKGRLAVSGTDTLVVPSNWKAFEINEGDDDYQKRQAQRDLFSLGTLTDINEAMEKNGMHKLTVASDDHGLEYYFRVDDDFKTRPMNYKTAMISLVGRYGLPVDDAEEMLKEAEANFKSRRTIKVAQIQSPMVGVSMPYPQEPPPEINPFNGVPIYQNLEQNVHGTLTGVPPKPVPNQYGINLGGEADMDVHAMQLAEQAGQTGQKHLFDHAAIGGLSKTYDTSAVIDSYTPEMMKALDRLGRLIFMFYWKNEDFADRYGINEMAEMEDMLRGVFKSFGELALNLRKKSIGNEDSSTSEL